MFLLGILQTIFRQDDAVSHLDFRVKKNPALRSHPRHTADLWIKGKQVDDNIETHLWRIHDGLYDFTIFVDQHPGGQDWLTLTKGTDITEAFEAHHISNGPEKLLSKYFVKHASTPRNSPFTFEENGFYRTLKRNVRDFLQQQPPHKGLRQLSDLYADMACISYFILVLSAAWFDSFAVAVIAGFVLTLTTIIAHNYFHRKDNFRMLYFDLSMMSSRSWRITHALSHHIYTNTIYDYEISFIEPFFQLLPGNKSFIVRYASWLYAPIIYGSNFFASYIRMLLQVRADGAHTFRPTALLPFVAPILMYIVAHTTLWRVLQLYICIIIVASTHFSMVGINAAHHHPDIFHDGDKPRLAKLDWGLHQLDTVADRAAINQFQFLVLTNFGEHALHHLFPTVDHGILNTLHPIVIKTCRQFDVQIRKYTQLELIRGQFLQLARVRGNTYDPRKRING